MHRERFITEMLLKVLFLENVINDAEANLITLSPCYTLAVCDCYRFVKQFYCDSVLI